MMFVFHSLLVTCHAARCGPLRLRSCLDTQHQPGPSATTDRRLQDRYNLPRGTLLAVPGTVDPLPQREAGRCQRILRPVVALVYSSQSLIDSSTYPLLYRLSHTPLSLHLHQHSLRGVFETKKLLTITTTTTTTTTTTDQIQPISLLAFLHLHNNPAQPNAFDSTKAASPRGILRGICTLRLLYGCQTTNQTRSHTRLFASLLSIQPQALSFLPGPYLAHYGSTRCHRRIARVGYIDLYSTRSSYYPRRCEA